VDKKENKRAMVKYKDVCELEKSFDILEKKW
jgi:hypothetical protein